MTTSERPREPGAAFLMAQLGAHAAAEFARRIAPLELTPAQAGVLRRLAQTPGESQRALADALGMHPSRLVALIDDLERRSWVRRTRDAQDRRSYALDLTEQGRDVLARLGAVAREHDTAMTAALDPEERTTLTALLRRVAGEQGLPPGVHPGYRRLT